MATIVITGGGTAGHVTPHLALLPYIKKDFGNVFYIGSENGMEKNIVENVGVKYYAVPCAKLVRKFTLKNIKIPFTLIKGIKEAGKIIDDLKPNIIFSKGGYVALPVVLAAKKRKIPVIAHESDYSAGLANRISAKYCEKVLTSFPQTAKTVKNGEYTGSPLRPELFTATKTEGLSFFGLDSKKPVLLITGGSLGATAINNAVRNSLTRLLDKFDIIHVCGKGNLSKNKRKGYVQVEFTDKMQFAFAAADLCVSRAGANTLFEISGLSLPALLIPLPKTVSRGDQILNAEYFKRLGTARVLYQENLTPETLVNEIFSLYAERKRIAENFKKHPINNAAPYIAKILKKYAR